jgi:hypothetical protein
MNDFSLILVGYAVAATLALLILVSTRRATTPPTILVQQERTRDDSLGCGAFLVLVALMIGAVLVGIALV